MKKAWLMFLLIPILSWTIEPALSNIITPKGGVSPISDNKTIIEKFWDAFEHQDQRDLNALLTPNYTIKDSSKAYNTEYSKYDAFSQNMDVRLKAMHSALPGFKIDQLEMIGEGNKVLSRIQISGVQKGAFLGVEPTNKPVVIKLFVLFTLTDGKISQIDEIWNEFGVMKQMGYIIL